MTEDLVARLVIGIVLAASGVLVIGVARATASGRIGRNHVAGIRIPSTMASDEAWLVAHRRAERPTIVAGVVTILSGAAVFLPLAVPLVGALVVAGCLSVLALVFYSAHVGGAAARALTTPPRT